MRLLKFETQDNPPRVGTKVIVVGKFNVSVYQFSKLTMGDCFAGT